MGGMRALFYILAVCCPVVALAAVAWACPLLGPPTLVSFARIACLVIGGVCGWLCVRQFDRLSHS